MSDYLVRAIKKLKPTAEFSIIDSDYSTVKWDVLEGKAPTLSEVEQAIKEVEAEEVAAIQAIADAKSALLERLGITEDEAKLLLA